MACLPATCMTMGRHRKIENQIYGDLESMNAVGSLSLCARSSDFCERTRPVSFLFISVALDNILSNNVVNFCCVRLV